MRAMKKDWEVWVLVGCFMGVGFSAFFPKPSFGVKLFGTSNA